MHCDVISYRQSTTPALTAYITPRLRLFTVQNKRGEVLGFHPVLVLLPKYFQGVWIIYFPFPFSFLFRLTSSFLYTYFFGDTPVIICHLLSGQGPPATVAAVVTNTPSLILKPNLKFLSGFYNPYLCHQVYGPQYDTSACHLT
jgi:hypothetical protein